MPLAMMSVSNWPARPTKGSPCRSSSAPGPRRERPAWHEDCRRRKRSACDCATSSGQRVQAATRATSARASSREAGSRERGAGSGERGARVWGASSGSVRNGVGRASGRRCVAPTGAAPMITGAVLGRRSLFSCSPCSLLPAPPASLAPCPRPLRPWECAKSPAPRRLSSFCFTARIISACDLEFSCGIYPPFWSQRTPA